MPKKANFFLLVVKIVVINRYCSLSQSNVFDSNKWYLLIAIIKITVLSKCDVLYWNLGV